MSSKKICFCIVGKSGSGKSTLVNELKKNYQLKVLNSYTNRPKRTINEKGHIFLEPGQEAQFKDVVASTSFGNYTYFATKDQVDNSDLYIIDKDGLVSLNKYYLGKDNKRDIISIYLKVPLFIRLYRCIKDDGLIRGIKRVCRDRGKFNNIEGYVDLTYANINNYILHEIEKDILFLQQLVD